MATLFAWTGALNKRGEMDGNEELCAFAKKVEKAAIDTISGGIMTGDMVPLFSGEATSVDSEAFLREIAGKLG